MKDTLTKQNKKRETQNKAGAECRRGKSVKEKGFNTSWSGELKFIAALRPSPGAQERK